jgi:hypothetical protein
MTDVAGGEETWHVRFQMTWWPIERPIPVLLGTGSRCFAVRKA